MDLYEDLQIRVYIIKSSKYTMEVEGRRGDVYVKRGDFVTLYRNIPVNLISNVIQTFVHNPGQQVEDFPSV